MARRTPTDPIQEPAKPGKVRKPKKTRWYHQVWQAYKMTTKADPKVNLWMALAALAVLGLAVAVGFWTHAVVYWTILGVPFALLAAMFILGRMAEKTAYANIEGQPGAARAVIDTIRRGWTFPQEPVYVDPRTHDLVFRGVGQPGVVLVSEGPPARVARLLDAERRKVARVASGAPVHTIQVGNAEGQVPLRKLPKALRSLKRTLSKAEVGEILRRLTAIGTAKMPLPKGIDPTRARPDRKAVR